MKTLAPIIHPISHSIYVPRVPGVLLLASALLSMFALPAMAAGDQSNNRPQTMEIIRVIYRSPLDYALYQQTTEILARFRLQVLDDIYTQARNDSRVMADQFNQLITPQKNRNDTEEQPQIQTTAKR